jgi:hypothetical protein
MSRSLRLVVLARLAVHDGRVVGLVLEVAPAVQVTLVQVAEMAGTASVVDDTPDVVAPRRASWDEGGCWWREGHGCHPIFTSERSFLNVLSVVKTWTILPAGGGLLSERTNIDAAQNKANDCPSCRV